MPIKYNLTKYDVLASEIRKLAVKYNTHHTYPLERKGNADGIQLSSEEIMLKAMAVLIASFSSSHSWQTHKCIENHDDKLSNAEIKTEYEEAERIRWQNVSLYDIGEIASTQIPDNVFYRWMFSNIEKDKQALYKGAWTELKKAFESSCDEIEQSKN